MLPAEGTLPGWLARQRWYTGKGRTPSLTVVGALPLAGGAVEVVSYLLRDTAAAPVLYQVPLTLRPAPVEELAGALVGTTTTDAGPRWVYDACHDPAGAAALLRTVLADQTSGGGDAGAGTGTVAARGHRAAGVPELTGSGSRVLRGEQSNTSIIYATEPLPVILKVFRVLHPGRNPDVEVQQALAGAGSTRVPRPVGDLLGRWPAAGGTAEGHLLLVQEFLTGAEDAWRVALDAVAHGADFAGPAHALGAAVAQTHALLAKALPTEEPTTARREALLATWLGRYDTACTVVPALAGDAARVRRVLAAGAAAPWPAMQRNHGDLHLGQVMDVPGRGWMLLDFEGEPLRPLAERTLPDLPQRDVAGMLRSFDYAGASAATTGATASTAAATWARRARQAFLAGYAAVTGHDEDPTLLRALELDKALYEAVYEASNRPDWLPVPLGGVARLLTGAGT
ncbi:maltokinase N-terminal cap-like domain-containing protein [Georgenia sp.]